jgi:hypothetical protein
MNTRVKKKIDQVYVIDGVVCEQASIFGKQDENKRIGLWSPF